MPSTYEIPETWINRAIASRPFQKYVTTISINPDDQKLLSEISQVCSKAITEAFSIDFALEIKTYYDLKLYLECARKEKISNPKDVIGHLEGSTYFVYIKPADSSLDSDAVLIYILEVTVKALLAFIFPDSTNATLSYYTITIIFEKIFGLSINEKEKQKMFARIESTFGEKIQGLSQLVTASSLSCPYCQSQAIEFLGLQSTGKVEIKGGIPILSGKSEDLNIMAYYRCETCKRVFYAQPEKAGQTSAK